MLYCYRAAPSALARRRQHRPSSAGVVQIQWSDLPPVLHCQTSGRTSLTPFLSSTDPFLHFCARRASVSRQRAGGLNDAIPASYSVDVWLASSPSSRLAGPSSHVDPRPTPLSNGRSCSSPFPSRNEFARRFLASRSTAASYTPSSVGQLLSPAVDVQLKAVFEAPACRPTQGDALPLIRRAPRRIVRRPHLLQ